MNLSDSKDMELHRVLTMKTLLFAFTGIVAFMLMTQMLHHQNYRDASNLHNTDDTREEVNFVSPNRGIPTITLPSGTR